MNRDEKDIVIKRILLEAVAMDMEEDATGTTVPTSPQFQREMKKMLKDPAGWLKRKRTPIWKKFLQAAAAVVLIFSFGIGSLMMLAPNVYAAITNWIVVFYEDRIVYMFAGKAEPIKLEDYYIADLPDGYHQKGEQIRITDDVRTIYKNDNDQTILLAVILVREGSALSIDTKNMIVSDISIHGHQGHLYISENDAISSGIIWYDADSNIQFMIDGCVESDVLQKMAESVTAKNK